jgi:FAD/FMN-containing dehydrogenase/Fe-S oxidoreductase
MTARTRLPQQSLAGREAAAELRRLSAGAVLDSPLSRWLYSTDASGYRVVPECVLVAAAATDLALAADIATRHGLNVVARGGASSLAGQAVGPGIMVDCFKLDGVVAIDPDRRTARVQPGVIQASLNRAAAVYGLEFGPDTSTVDQATIGGMVGNNSSGSRSIVYGESVDKVLRLEAVLADGSALTVGQCQTPDLASGLDGARGPQLARALTAIRDRSAAQIRDGFPQTRRCTTGYNLRALLPERPNLARLLAGSEGSLALFTELEVELDERPAMRLGAALSFVTLRRAFEANLAILTTGPSAIELLDLAPLRASPNLRQYPLLTPLIEGSEPAMLTVEYQGTEDEARAGVSRLRALAGELGAAQILYLDEPADMAQAAALRRAALPLLMGAPGAERPASIVEDTAVAPERLADFVEDFQRVVAEQGVRASFTGHASAGCMHVRPLLDQKTAAGVAKLEGIALAVGKLVAEYHGAISGEHGCGRSRSWLLPQLFGPEVYGEMVALKDAFDPQRVLAPGAIVDGPPVAQDLRFGADYRTSDGWKPRLSYAAEGGFDLAIERCFGAAQCRKLTGTMCPPAAVTREEGRSTRARANALQAIISGAIDLGQITDQEMKDVLGTCVACKACKTECPAGVDMAALKVEWLAERRAREGVPLLARGVGNIRRLFRLASPFAPLVNAGARLSLRKPIMRAVGAADARPAPPIARRPLTRRVRPLTGPPVQGSDPERDAARSRRFRDDAGAEDSAAARAPAVAEGQGAARPPIVLFADCFTQYQEPEIGEAFVRLMRATGAQVSVIDAGCCGRTMMSTGLLDKARTTAEKTLRALWTEVRAGRVLAFVEPSCLSMVHDDWHRLLPDDPRVAEVAAASRFALSFVADEAAAGRLRYRPGGAALLHPHCHERSLFTSAETERALRAVPGLVLQVLDAGCCGMSGVFGYEAEHYDLSVAIAERDLLPAVRAAGAGTAILATGTSCRTQIGDLSPRRAEHPLTFLADRLIRDAR